MTLPSSGNTISLSQVRTEMALSGQIDLGGTNPASSIRTLFGVPTGQISLSQGWGKTAPSTMGYRPSASHYNGGQVGTGNTGIANAYDGGTTNAVNPGNTCATLYGPAVGYDTDITYNGFSGSASRAGYLHIYGSLSAPQNVWGNTGDGDWYASAYAWIGYSVDGTTWHELYDTWTSYDLALGDHSFALTCVPNTLQVRILLTGDNEDNSAYADAYAQIYDIVFVAAP